MGAAQNTFTFAPSTTQILHQTAPNATEPGHGNNLLRGRQSQSVALPLTTTGATTQGHQGMEHQSEHGTADRDSMDDGDQESDLDLHSEGPPELPRAASMLTAKQMKKLKKKRKSMIRASASSRQVLETPPAEGRKRSGSGGSIKSARSWDNEYDAVSVGSNEREKVKNRTFRSASMTTKMKSKKMKMEIEEAVPEIVEFNSLSVSIYIER